MEDNNKKNSYDDFFTRKPEQDEQDGQSRYSEQASSEKPSYYYSYGPFKSTAEEQEARREPIEQTEVQITPPVQSRSYAPATPAVAPKSGWQVRTKQRTSFKALFASFLAGVIIIGSLMAVADYRNWFTSAGPLASEPTNQSVQASTANGSASPPPASTVNSALDSARPNNIAAIFNQASPAVVKIETFVQARSSTGSTLDPFFRQFFGEEPRNESSNELTPSGLGSGFFFDDTGYILTNQHVIGDATKIEVTVQGFAKTFEAKLLGSSYELDLAVLKIEGEEAFPTLELGSSDNINIGDWVIAIGNPHGFDHTLTVGVLSSKERPISIPDSQGTRNYEHLLQTDASINPGNSGGPLLNTNGQVIGINTAVSSQAQGIGFAIPTSTILEVLDNLKENKKIPLPFIGAELMDLTKEYAQQLGINEVSGALVRNVYYNSPAYKGDLRQFDVITGLNGEKYPTMQELIAQIKKKEIGESVTINVIRDGKALELTVEIGDMNTFNVPQ